MMKRMKYRDIVWVDLDSPTDDDIASIAREFSIHPLALEELRMPSPRPKIATYNDFLYLILHFPVCQLCLGLTPVEDTAHQEIDFIVGHYFIITTHYQAIESLTDLTSIFESELSLARRKEKLHAGYIFYYLLRQVYHSLYLGLDYLVERLRESEKKIFAGEEKAMVQTLARVNHDLLDFRRSLQAHREILSTLRAEGGEFFGQSFVHEIFLIQNEYEKIWSQVEDARAFFFDLRETNDSLLTIKNNELVKFLSVIAFIFLPTTVVIQLFNMNLEVPFSGLGRGGFYLVLALTAIITGLMYRLAKSRRWL